MKYKVGDRVWYCGEKLTILDIRINFYNCLDCFGCIRFILKHRAKPIITLKAELA